MFENIKILWHQGKQFIPDVRSAKVPGIFKGIPVINSEDTDESFLVETCPTGAISTNPFRIDLGMCTFCGECAVIAPNKISFSTDYKMSTNIREDLYITEGPKKEIRVNAENVRKEIHSIFGSSLKLRQISAGGDNSCEWELNACNNVQFDMSRFGIDFVASPRHADGIVITGPISQNMAEPLERCYLAVPQPRIIILAGTDAISGGIFADSAGINRSFLGKYPIDLYVPGNPVHPLTFINGVLDLCRKK